MAKVISSLSIGLGANVAPWVGGLTKAGNAIGGLQARASSFAGTMAKWTGIGTVIGGLAGGAGLGMLIHKQAEAIDANGKLSDRLGITTESLSSLQHAAGLSGVSTETLTGGMEKYLKNVAGAAGGNDKLAGAFTDLGLSAADLVNQPTDVAIGKIGDALNAIDNPAQRAAAAQAVFGKSGQALLPFLAEGSEGFAEMARKTDAMGLSYSRVDAAKVEEANDALSEAGNVASGIGTQLAIGVAPFVTRAAGAFTDFGVSVVARVKSIVPPVAAVFNKLVNVVVPLVQSAASGIYAAVTSTWASVWSVVGPVVGQITDWVTGNWQSILTSVVRGNVAMWSSVRGVFYGVWSIVGAAAEGVVVAWNGAMNMLGVSTATAGESVGSTTQTIGGWMLGLSNGIGTAFTYAGWIFSNFASLVQLEGLIVAQSVVKMGGDIEWAVNSGVEYVKWFGDNWANVLTNVAGFAGTVFTNMAANVGGFFSGVWGWLTGSGGDFKWTALTEGFQSTLSELPTMAARAAGPLEEALGQQIEGMAGQLNSSLADALAQNAAMTDGITGGITGAVANAFRSTAQDESAFFEGDGNPFAKVPPAPFQVDTSEADEKIAKTADAAKTSFGNIVSGSAEQSLRIAQAGFATRVAPVATPKDKASDANQLTMIAELRNVTKAIQDKDEVELVEIGF